MTPAVAFVTSVLLAWLVAVLTGLLWWLNARRTMRLVVAFAVQALADGLDDLAGDAARQEAERCRQLCAAVLRLLLAAPVGVGGLGGVAGGHGLDPLAHRQALSLRRAEHLRLHLGPDADGEARVLGLVPEPGRRLAPGHRSHLLPGWRTG